MAKANYVVIFTSRLKNNAPGYDEVGDALFALVEKQPGFVSFQSVRDADGNGITLSYWETVEAIQAWAEVPEHCAAKARGRTEWYEAYDIKFAKLEDPSWQPNR